MKRINFLCCTVLFITTTLGLIGTTFAAEKKPDKPKKFFSDTSFWNQPIPDNPQIDPNSDHYIALLKTEPTGHRFVINCDGYTIPVYQADADTPKHNIKRRGLIVAQRSGLDPNSPRYQRIARMGHGPGFGKDVPIPDGAVPDPNADAHIAIVDWSKMICWDMFAAEKLPDGSWCSYTGMVYRLDGDGVFDGDDFPVKDDDSIHFYGPGRAAGVPIIAGLIMYDEVLAGEIRHKIAAASRFNALKEFVFPATWTDGNLQGGIPEGAVIQLDPKLDLDKFDMLPGEKAIAKALQKYGMVIVDWSGGSVLYAEGLYGHKGKSWNGIINKFGGIDSIPLEHYRVLKLGKVTYKGDHKRPTPVAAAGSTGADQSAPQGEIRLIVRGDDIGCSHAANIGCIKSYREGIMRTVEVMVPCPWFEEAVKMLSENPGLDVGIHLTLTSEWDNYKWKPLTCGKSIVNKNGYFYQQTREWNNWPAGTGFYDANATVEDVEAELRAQIETALKRIKNVSHLSDHMGAAHSRPDLAELVAKLAKEYNLDLELGQADVKHLRMGAGTDRSKGRESAMVEALEKLEPGTWITVEHPGMDTPEMQAMGHSGYENVGKDRGDVTDTFTSEKVKEVVKRRGIKLISYGDVKKERKSM